MLIGALAALATPGFAADDPIATRQALMDNNGASAALAGAVMKGEVEYSPVIGKAVIVALSATAHAYGDYFPEGSADPDRSYASPKIWEDMAGFQATLGKFQAAVAQRARGLGQGRAGRQGRLRGGGPAGARRSARPATRAYRLEN